MRTQLILHLHMVDIAQSCKLSPDDRTKLVEHAIKNGWKNTAKALKMIPGDSATP